MGSKLVVLHIDGLSADLLEHALADGQMPFTRRLIETEHYELHRYRCGIPSTTPFVQAGILYGDNSEIPSFRWWDREQQVLVKFGPGSTFKKVAEKYFQGCVPLTRDGACIAACYPGGAAEDFGIAYRDRTYGEEEGSRSAWKVVLPYLANPLNLGDWVWYTLVSIWRTGTEYIEARRSGRRPAVPYVLIDALEEIFVHHLTRFAVEQAMREGFSPIYAALYAFDETGHAFGPGDAHTRSILRHVDHSIQKVADARRGKYELVVLSDHGQLDTVAFYAEDGIHLGQLVANSVPGFRVEEQAGKTFGAAKDVAKGTIKLTYAGGLAHLYLTRDGRRLEFEEIANRHPGLMRSLASHERVALVMARTRREDVFLAGETEYRGPAVKEMLRGYDDAEILFEQLHRLNSFERSGDLILFAAFKGDQQYNFENQAGGHGAFGGEQAHPFVLAKRGWGVDTSQVFGAHQLHPILSELRDRLAVASE